MRIRIGSFQVAAQYLPTLQRIADTWGGAITITDKGIYYEAPLRTPVCQELPPLPLEVEHELRRMAA